MIKRMAAAFLTAVFLDRTGAGLLPTEEAPEGAKVRLVYGTIGINYIIKDKIQKFNAANKEYYIEYRDYSEEVLRWSGDKNTPVYQNALSRLYAEIATGRCPDILDETVPLDRLARQGALEDLWPWIDSDPEISRDGLMEHVLECLEVDGKLPQVCSGFQIETVVTSAAVAGNRSGREPLTDYDQRLWDADIIYTDGIIPYTGEELIRTRYNFDDSQTGWWSNGFTKIQPFRYKSPREKVAGDCTAGAADRNIYASYVGFPTAGGTGSSFTLHLSMGILRRQRGQGRGVGFCTHPAASLQQCDWLVLCRIRRRACVIRRPRHQQGDLRGADADADGVLDGPVHRRAFPVQKRGPGGVFTGWDRCRTPRRHRPDGLPLRPPPRPRWTGSGGSMSPHSRLPAETTPCWISSWSRRTCTSRETRAWRRRRS